MKHPDVAMGTSRTLIMSPITAGKVKKKEYAANKTLYTNHISKTFCFIKQKKYVKLKFIKNIMHRES